MDEEFSSIEAALLRSVERRGIQLAAEHLQLGVDVVELLGRGGAVLQQIFHAAAFGLLLGDLLAQRSHLLRNVGAVERTDAALRSSCNFRR